MKNKNLSKTIGFIVLSGFIILLSSCELLFGTDNKSDKKNAAVTKVAFSSTDLTKTLTFLNLSGKSVYLVKANTSSSSVAEDDSGTVKDASSMSVNRSVLGDRSLAVKNASKPAVKGRVDYARATEFNANLPPISRTNARGALSSSLSSILAHWPSFAYTALDLYQERAVPFWVEDSTGAWVPIPAKLQAIGNHCYVWVANANYEPASAGSNDNKITRAQAEQLAAKFDLAYPLETSLVGYEYGGDPADAVTPVGGVDGDVKISILVYDIADDYSFSQTGGIYGFFWGKDEFAQTTLDDMVSLSPELIGMKSNEAEMFYLDSAFTDADPDQMYSTLVHEFQHMINFNEKYVKQQIDSDTWFNEMLSQLCEDVISPKIGIDSSASPASSRMPLFNAYYDYVGVTQWYSAGTTDEDFLFLLMSYSNSYAFGAYLVRNYGGASLLSLMAKNNRDGISSISSALSTLYPKEFDAEHDGFSRAFRRYGEALVFSGRSVTSAVNTFDRSVSTLIAGNEYIFPAIDIWAIDNYNAGYNGMAAGYKGPTVYSINDVYALPPYTHTLQSADEWQNVKGNLIITLTKPIDPDVTLYIMIR